MPRVVKELDALTISLTVWFCRVKQSQALGAKHLAVWERSLLVACSHPTQSSSTLDANQPVAAMQPMFFTPHVSQVLHKGTVTWECFSLAAVPQSLMMLFGFWVACLMLYFFFFYSQRVV